MLPGKFVDIVVDFENTQELLTRVKEGYLKASWKDGEELKTGYLLVSSGKIVGMLIEDTFTRKILKGKSALADIVKTSRERRVKAVEIYEAPVKEILKELPEIGITLLSLPEEIPGHNIQELIDLMKSYKGELKIHDGSTSWSLHVDKGKVKAAKTLKGPKLRGEEAMTHLFMEMGEIIKNGKYETGGTITFSKHDELKRENVFLDALELLRDKQEIDKKT